MIHAIAILTQRQSDMRYRSIQYLLRPGHVMFRVVVSPPISEQDWMYEVLDCFDTIVLNAGNTFRLQEECAFHSCITQEKRGIYYDLLLCHVCCE